MADGVWRETRANSRWLMVDSISQKKQDFLCSCYKLLAISYRLLFPAISYEPSALFL